MAIFDEHADWPGLERLREAMRTVPPPVFAWSGSLFLRERDILEALRAPRLFDFAKLDAKIRRERERIRAECEATAFYDPAKGAYFAKPYDGPDMNEVDAALEAIERMEA